MIARVRGMSYAMGVARNLVEEAARTSRHGAGIVMEERATIVAIVIYAANAQRARGLACCNTQQDTMALVVGGMIRNICAGMVTTGLIYLQNTSIFQTLV